MSSFGTQEEMQAKFHGLMVQVVHLLAEASRSGMELRLVRCLPEEEKEGPVQPWPGAQNDWRGVLREYVSGLHQPSASAEIEVEDLQDLVRDTHRLRTFPSEVQILLLQYAVARVRAWQSVGRSESAMLSVVSAVGRYAKENEIGFVYGPMRTHRPRGDSWENDARSHLEKLMDIASASEDGSVTPARLVRLLERAVEDAESTEEVFAALGVVVRSGVSQNDQRLVRLLDPFVEDLDATGRYKTLRGAIRASRKGVAAADSAPIEDPVLVPEDWSWLAFTRGKRAVIVGGDPREPNRDRIQRAFGFAELDWEPSAGRRNPIQQVRDRVAGGGTDFVILLRRFIGHDADNMILPACRDAGVPWISVPSGYGISRILLEIERMIPKPS